MRASSSCTLAIRCLVGFLFLIPAPVQAQDAEASEALLGLWSAEEDYFSPAIRFERGPEGAVQAFLGADSPGRAPFTDVTIRGDSVLLTLDRINVQFRGAVSAMDSVITGTWVQGAQSVSLTLTPVKERAAPPRPQHPEPPYPYATEEVTFRNATDSVALAGTLTLPRGEGPHPAVVLLSGSTPVDRDAAMKGHKPFLVLADHLTRHGIAVLRYDKRGVAQSGGSIQSAHFEDLARDAAAALRFLKNHPAVEASSAGLMGHSAGGLIAPLASDRFEEAAFLVLLLSPGRPGHEVLVEQTPRLAAAAGAPEAEVDSLRSTAHRIFDVLRADADSAVVASRLRSILERQGATGQLLQTQVEANTMPWFRDFARHDPRPLLRKVDVPVLALFGTKDLFVPPGQNAPPVRAALAESPSGDTTLRVLDGLNHWMQPAETGLTGEIAQIETTIAPALLERITHWIRTHTPPGE